MPGSLNDITREAVLAAIAEYDRLGQEEFLSLHGFDPPASMFWFTTEIIHADGRKAVTRVLDEESYQAALLEKLTERPRRHGTPQPGNSQPNWPRAATAQFALGCANFASSSGSATTCRLCGNKVIPSH